MVDILIIITGFTIFSLIVLAFGLLLYWTYKELNKYKQVGRGLGITEGRIKSGQPKIYDYDVTKIKTMPRLDVRRTEKHILLGSVVLK